jgi:hypothetical protein
MQASNTGANRSGGTNNAGRNGTHPRTGRTSPNHGNTRGRFDERSGGGARNAGGAGGAGAGRSAPPSYAGGGGVVNNPGTGGFGAAGFGGTPGGDFGGPAGGYDASYGGGLGGGGGGYAADTSPAAGDDPMSRFASSGDKLGASSRSPASSFGDSGDPGAGGYSRNNTALAGAGSSPSSWDPAAGGNNRNNTAFGGGRNPTDDPISGGNSRGGNPGTSGGPGSADSGAGGSARGFDPASSGDLGGTDPDDDSGTDVPYGRYLDHRFLILENRTGLPLKIWLRYRSRINDGAWRWFPGGTRELMYVLAPSEIRYVGDRTGKILAERVTIWARDESGMLYDTYRFRELVLGRPHERDRYGNLAYPGTHYGTFTYRFR